MVRGAAVVAVVVVVVVAAVVVVVGITGGALIVIVVMAGAVTVVSAPVVNRYGMCGWVGNESVSRGKDSGSEAFRCNCSAIHVAC